MLGCLAAGLLYLANQFQRSSNKMGGDVRGEHLEGPYWLFGSLLSGSLLICAARCEPMWSYAIPHPKAVQSVRCTALRHARAQLMVCHEPTLSVSVSCFDSRGSSTPRLSSTRGILTLLTFRKEEEEHRGEAHGTQT